MTSKKVEASPPIAFNIAGNRSFAEELSNPHYWAKFGAQRTRQGSVYARLAARYPTEPDKGEARSEATKRARRAPYFSFSSRSLSCPGTPKSHGNL